MEQNIPEPIKLFLERLLTEKGVAGVSAELKEDMLSSLFKRLQAWLLTDLAKELSKEDSVELNKMMEKGEARESIYQDFFKTKIKNFDEVFAQSLLDFREIYLKG